MPTLSLTIPAAKAAKILAAYGTKEAVLAEIREVLAAKVREYERREAEKVVAYPPDEDFSGLAGNIA